MTDPIDHFLHAIAATGLPAPDVVHGDGKLRRLSTSGRRGEKNGWYVLFTDGVAAGAFGCWRLGLQSTWCSKNADQMTATERRALHDRLRAVQTQRDAPSRPGATGRPPTRRSGAGMRLHRQWRIRT